MPGEILHVVGPAFAAPDLQFLGSTKDLMGRQEYLAARGFRTTTVIVASRSDERLLAYLQSRDLQEVSCIWFENLRYPRSMAYVRATAPQIVLVARAINAEFLHSLHTALAYLLMTPTSRAWRWKKCRRAFLAAFRKLRLDLRCSRLATYVALINSKERRVYWHWFVSARKLLDLPYYLPDRYLGMPFPEASLRPVVMGSADFNPLAWHSVLQSTRLWGRHTAEADLPRVCVTGQVPNKALASGVRRTGNFFFLGDDRQFADLMNSPMVLLHPSALGYGLKTKIHDAISAGGFAVVPRALADRMPDEYRPGLIILTKNLTLSAIMGRAATMARHQSLNAEMRRQAMTALDRLFADISVSRGPMREVTLT
jgi:hypothetical protein